MRRRWLGVGWIVLGVVILAWPSLSVAALAVVIGVALVVNGLVDVVGAVTGGGRPKALKVTPPSPIKVGTTVRPTTWGKTWNSVPPAPKW